VRPARAHGSRQFFEMCTGRPMYFVPEAQTTHFDEPSLQTREVWSHYPYNIVIWALGNPPDLAAQITKALAAFDIPIYDVQPYSGVISTDFGQST
jgi:putative ABC transport system permease protein